jgi:quercetin dioxygenase-like cupin family protein
VLSDVSIIPAGKNSAVQMFPGVTRQLITHGQRAMVVRISMSLGSHIPSHSHPHEQIGFLLLGKMRLTISGNPEDLCAGDAYSIPSNALHSVDATEDCVAIDVFSPLREEYL